MLEDRVGSRTLRIGRCLHRVLRAVRGDGTLLLSGEQRLSDAESQSGSKQQRLSDAGSQSGSKLASRGHDAGGTRAGRADADAGGDPVEGAAATHTAAACAACGCTAIALASEVVQFAGVALIFFLAEALTGTSPIELVEAFISGLRDMGLVRGAMSYCALLVGLQMFPVAAALLPILCAGAIFGVPLGTALVVLSSTTSAVAAALVSRLVCRTKRVDAWVAASRDLSALDAAFAAASWPSALLLILLVRLASFVPFSWSNYAFGLTAAPLSAFALATAIGSVPNSLAYVSSGTLGAAFRQDFHSQSGISLGVVLYPGLAPG